MCPRTAPPRWPWWSTSWCRTPLKYAFPSGQAGRIGIELHSGRPLCQLTVWDNGVGFQADRPRPGGAGLELASTIVREKLTGEWSVESGPGGTRISFDFLEQ